MGFFGRQRCTPFHDGTSNIFHISQVWRSLASPPCFAACCLVAVRRHGWPASATGTRTSSPWPATRIVILFIIRSARVRHAHAWHVRRAAGVERVFSAAGKMHDNLRKSMKDSTLEHSLFAAFNIERAIINPPSSIKTSHQHRKDISAVLSVWLHYPLGLEMWGG